MRDEEQLGNTQRGLNAKELFVSVCLDFADSLDR
jgi:hypothetical protein